MYPQFRQLGVRLVTLAPDRVPTFSVSTPDAILIARSDDHPVLEVYLDHVV
jgi:hypothetical protein